jgi:O-succinylbenzoic acid--CoA ligase
MTNDQQQTMNQPWLQLNGKIYSYPQLELGDGTTEFEKSTLAFCRDWLGGKDHFTLSTSGSTGVPKPITLRRGQMEASARLTAAALDLRSGYQALLCLDTRYIAGQMMLVRSFVTGMNIVAVEPSANPFDSIQPDLRIDFAAIVPYQLQAILASPSGINKLNNLKAILVGGATVSAKVKALLHPLRCPVYSSYGMTETISHIALQRLNGPSAQDYFQVLPGISIATDARGCLTIAAGYLGTDKIITNDLVEILSAQQFQWRGRWDRVINTGGVKVIPEKIEKECEKIMEALGLVNRCFVTGLSDDRLGAKVTLIVEGAPFSESTQRDFRARLEKELSQYEVPKEMRFIPHFAETSTRKIDQRVTLLSSR